MLRSVVSVVAGYLVFGVSAALLFGLSGRDPHATQDAAFVVLSTAYGVAFAGAGGYVAATIARRRPLLHAGIVAILIALGAIISLAASPGSGAIWSQLVALVLMAPAALAGGALVAAHRMSAGGG